MDKEQFLVEVRSLRTRGHLSAVDEAGGQICLTFPSNCGEPGCIRAMLIQCQPGGHEVTLNIISNQELLRQQSGSFRDILALVLRRILLNHVKTADLAELQQLVNSMFAAPVPAEAQRHVLVEAGNREAIWPE